MLIFERERTQYDVGPDCADNMLAAQPHLNQGERWLVFVMYDKSCFISNDGKTTIWMSEDNRPLRPKGEGRSVTVSDIFSLRMSVCRGPLTLSPDQQAHHPGLNPETVVIIRPGKWWVLGKFWSCEIPRKGNINILHFSSRLRCMLYVCQFL
jgi:hypothetical protein